MEGQVMSKEQVIEETIKLLSFIELPMVHQKPINSIQGSIRNLTIVLEMMKAEKEASMQEEKNGNVNAE